jgi:hypothetical protein
LKRSMWTVAVVSHVRQFPSFARNGNRNNRHFLFHHRSHLTAIANTGNVNETLRCHFSSYSHQTLSTITLRKCVSTSGALLSIAPVRRTLSSLVLSSTLLYSSTLQKITCPPSILFAFYYLNLTNFNAL